MATNGNAYRAYSMEYGTFVGLGWGATFLCYVGGILTGSSLLMLLLMATGAVSLVLPFRLALRMNRKLQAVGGRLSYWQGLLFSFSMLMYACLMNALVIYTYFALFDNGALVEQISQMLSESDIVATYQQMGMSDSYTLMTQTMDEVANLSAFEKTLMLFNSNFLFSIILSFLVAISASYPVKNSQ